MTTRRVSADTVYPFVPPSAEPAIAGILDIYLVVQGPGDTGSSSSSGPDRVDLVGYDADTVPGTTTFLFQACSGARTWSIGFDVPRGLGGTGSITNNAGTECYGVLVFDAEKVLASGAAPASAEVEPGRTQWYVEQVDSIAFYNTWRCAGIESGSSSMAEASYGADMTINFEDGYNCTVQCSSGSLEFTAGVGLGKGIAPDYGDTASECSSAQALDYLRDVVTTINGIAPVDGNIPIRTSPLIGIQRSTGRIELIIR